MAQWHTDDAVPTGDDHENVSTLPTYVHVDEDVYEQEQEKIFTDSWQYIGSKNDVLEEGEYFTANVAGRPLFVIRTDDGSIEAYYNVCPHRGSRMLDGSGTANRIMCPYHNWTFDKDGEFCSAPNSFSNAVRNPELDDDDVEPPCSEENNLRSLAVETLGPFIFVNLSPDPRPFEEFVGSLPTELNEYGLDDLEHVKTREKELECNWKVMASNYLECDHCHSNHPDFVREVNMDEYVVELEDYYSVQHGPVENDEGEVVGESRFYFLWPNTTINIYQAGSGCAVYRIVPKGPEKTVLTADYYFEDDEIGDEESEIIETSFQLQREDFELVERQHEGVRSGALARGTLGPNEHAVNHFHGLVEERLDLE